MLVLNGKKLAKNDNEFINSLFQSGDTCVGYYKVNKKSIYILDMQKNRVGVIVNNVLGKCSRLDSGKYWYSYGDIDIIGMFNSYSDEREDIKKAMELLSN